MSSNFSHEYVIEPFSARNTLLLRHIMDAVLELGALIGSYLSGGSFPIKFGGELSTSRDIRAGVPQGFLLGPQFFIYYTSDIPRSPNTRLVIYGDDATIYTSFRNDGLIFRRLQRSVDDIRERGTSSGLSINAAKCGAIRFSRNEVISGSGASIVLEAGH